MTQRRGYILVQALIVVAGLVALMTMLAADQHASLEGVQNRLRQRRADAAADAAVARALAVLEDDNPNVVTLSDDWAFLGDSGSEQFDLGDATFRMQIVDAGALVNVNTASQQQLQLLPLDPDQIDCLLDWREPKLQPRTDGAKDAYYNGLPQPYNTRLGPLATVDELLLVKNWTAATLYQAPTAATPLLLPTDSQGNPLALAALLTVDSGAPNTQADGSARLDFAQRPPDSAALQALGISQTLAAQIAARGPQSSFQNLFSMPGLNTDTLQKLLNAATFTGSDRLVGKINLNTATEAVLRTIPTMTPDLASAIVTQQSSGFHSLGDLATVSGMTPQRLAQLADAFTVGSDTWLVRAYGESGGASTAVEAVVGSRSGQVEVITWSRLHTVGVPAWWRWDAQAGETVDAGSAQ